MTTSNKAIIDCFFAAVVIVVVSGCFLISGCSARCNPVSEQTPLSYNAFKLQTGEKILMDGQLNEPAWTSVPFTADFVDIHGAPFPKPRFATRVKMRWDNQFLYVGAYIEEPQIWANETQRNSVIFNDNDFEIFVCPDGTNHWYKEFEMNARNAIWSLVLNQPYINGGNPVNQDWTIKTAVYIDGKLNDPNADNKFWSVEVALPLDKYVINCTGVNYPPRVNDIWRINFSRVEWRVRVVNGRYEKVPNVREDNWVWSPQHTVNMHLPERWGFVVFAERGSPVPDPAKATNYNIRLALAQSYYNMQAFGAVNGYVTADYNQWMSLPDNILDGSLGTTPPVAVVAFEQYSWSNITVRDAMDPKGLYGTINNARYLQIFHNATQQE